MEKTRTFWTRQVTQVWEELQKTGTYRVKKEYIEKKNGAISGFYLDLYRWYTKEAAKHIAIPEGCEYPVWLSVSEENMLQPVEGTVILKVEVPEGNYILCNMDNWGYRVNYWYIPLNPEDEEAHQRELKRYGIAAEDELVLGDKGNFYPLLKRKITESWERVFTMLPEKEEAMVATVWELKKEWIRSVEPER